MMTSDSDFGNKLKEGETQKKKNVEKQIHLIARILKREELPGNEQDFRGLGDTMVSVMRNCLNCAGIPRIAKGRICTVEVFKDFCKLMPEDESLPAFSLCCCNNPIQSRFAVPGGFYITNPTAYLAKPFFAS